MIKIPTKEISLGEVLDVGTGIGEFIELLKNQFKDYQQIIGIDTKENKIEIARKNHGCEKIQFVKMAGEKIDFEDASFDTVCISNSLHHLSDISKTLVEMKRVLRPEGLLIINEMFCDNQNEVQMNHVLLHHLTAEINRLLGEIHNDTFKKQEIIEIVTRADLQPVHVFEFKNEEEILTDRKTLEAMAESLDQMIENTKDRSSYEDLKTRGEMIKQRIFDMGMAGATQLMIIAKK